MKITIGFSLVSLALAAPLFGQTDLDAITQLRQLQIIPLGAPVSAIPMAGEVAPIAGKPYSGIGRTVEYSPDGAHIDRSESNRFDRDEQGRTRRETGGGKFVSIVDPVAGVAFSLQTESRTGMKRSIAAPRPTNQSLQPGSTAPIRLKILNQTVRTIYETVAKLAGISVLWDPETATKNLFSVDLNTASLEQALTSVAATSKTYWKTLSPGVIFVTDNASKLAAGPPQMSLVEAAREQARRSRANSTVDDLGTQVVNGVTAQGVRTTSVIPTGAIGNDHDIKMVTERWVSEDLHVLVKSVYTDSRTGSTVYDLINISQAPPDPALFQVPNGYTVQEGGRGGRGGR